VENLLERIDLWSVTGRLAAGSVLNAKVKTHLLDWGATVLTVADHELRIPAINASPGTLVRLRVQAKDVALATQKPVGLSIRNILSAQILSIDIEEDVFAEVLLDIGGTNLRARVTREAIDDLKLTTGRKVYALIKSVVFEGQLFAK
ncbi:MAG: TOBE domain-containing protein, partial [Pseudomonadota bacterium]|nr:TOBE domain-containing protein [Pseudomonadota bacterium]